MDLHRFVSDVILRSTISISGLFKYANEATKIFTFRDLTAGPECSQSGSKRSYRRREGHSWSRKLKTLLCLFAVYSTQCTRHLSRDVWLAWIRKLISASWQQFLDLAHRGGRQCQAAVEYVISYITNNFCVSHIQSNTTIFHLAVQ